MLSYAWLHLNQTSQLWHSGREKVRLFKGCKEMRRRLNALTFVYSAELLSPPKIAVSIALAF